MQHVLFCVRPLLFLRVLMDELQNMRLPLGTKGWNHSYYKGIPLSALHSLQQLQAGASSLSPVQISASTQESHGAATSSSVSCPQVTHSGISPQVQTCLTRTVTSDLMSATHAEDATQLSLAAFLECCISVSASPPPATHPHPTSRCRHADYSTHRCLSGRFHATLARGVLSLRCVHLQIPRGPWLHLSTHDVLCSKCSRPVPSLLLDAAVQTPLYSVASHDAST